MSMNSLWEKKEPNKRNLILKKSLINPPSYFSFLKSNTVLSLTVQSALPPPKKKHRLTFCLLSDRPTDNSFPELNNYEFGDTKKSLWAFGFLLSCLL